MTHLRKPLIAICLAIGFLVPTLGGAAEAAEPYGVVDTDGAIQSFEGEDLWAEGLAEFKMAETVNLYVHLESPKLLDVVKQIKTNTGMSADAQLDTNTLAVIQRNVINQQAPVAEALEALGGTVISQMQTTLNVVHVSIDRDQLGEIAKIPGVARVSRVPLFELHMDDARGHVGATQVAEELGFDGTGTTIAIIDTGIDYTHLAFGGSGDPDDANFNDTEVIDDVQFPTEKVVGGWDFVGFDYNGGTVPAPDPDPFDDVQPGAGAGHGTHVAGIAAAMEAGDVPAGIAPGASLVALKVFGATGGTNVTTEAIEWAVNHNLFLGEDNEMVPGTRPDTPIDIINMSLGASWGQGMKEYTEVTDAAIEQGITIVASAGNSGPTPYITGAPGATPKILSVANTYASGEMTAMVTSVWNDGADQKQEDNGNEVAAWTTQLGEVAPVTAELAWYGEACNDAEGNATPPEQEVSEKIALIARGSCSFYTKIKNAADAGAVATLVFTDEQRPRVGMGCAAPDPCDNPGITGVMIDYEPGVALRDLLMGDDAPVVTTTLDMAEASWLTDTIAGSSSRGPGRWHSHIKPQISGPGQNILSTQWLTGDGAFRLSGTSMAGPLVAGVTALLRQRSNEQGLDLGADHIAALAMNYANPIITRDRNDTGPTEGVTRQGAGLVQAYDSSTANTIVQSEMGIAELSFGNTHVTEEAKDYSQTLTIHNISDAEKTYAVDYEMLFEDDMDAGVSLAFDMDTVTVDAGGSADLGVTMTVDPEGAREWDNYGQHPLIDEARLAQQEADGHVHLTEIDEMGSEIAGGDMVGIPFQTMAFLRACTVQDTEEQFQIGDPSETLDTAWTNECSGSGQLALYWNVESDELESRAGELPPELDIASVGVRYGTGTLPTSVDVEVVEFLIAFEDSSVLMNSRDIFIYVDGDSDGTFDMVLFNVQSGAAPNAFYSVWAPFDADNMAPVADQAQWFTYNQLAFVDQALDDTVVALSMPVATIAEGASLESGDLSFSFAVEVSDGAEDYSVGDDLFTDQAPDDLDSNGVLTFDQALLECMTLNDIDGKALISPFGRTPVASNDSVVGSLEYVCDMPAEGAEALRVGMLSHYINNVPGNGSSWSLRSGVIGSLPPEVPEGIYLPWLAYQYEDEG